MNCGLIIPTLNAGENFQTLLEQIGRQTLPTKNLIVDSESTDATVELAKRFGFEVLTVERKKFNHGLTRQAALSKLLQETPLDVIIFLTQDVLLRDAETLSRLVEIFSDETVGLSYGRQLPKENATLEAKILREFNYPAQSQLKNFDDRKTLGLKTAFASNSFAAYRVDALTAVGGFPATILSEDMYVAAKMLLAGYKVAYVAGAEVFHSHDYTFAQEFRRYFDIGVFQSRESWIGENFGKAEGTGRKFIAVKYSRLWRESVADFARGIFHDAVKFFGYRLGRLERFLPAFIIKRCTMHKNFWN